MKIPEGSSNSDGEHFEPGTLTIAKRTTVRWINEDSTLHTVTSGSAEGGESGTIFDSSYMAGGKTFQWTFSNTGTFEYYCTLHPFMTAKIIVVNSPTGLVTTHNQVNITNPNISNELQSQHINALSNATSNATGEAMAQANNLLNMASSAASNATQTAIDQTRNILANITSNVSNLAANPSPNVTSATMTNYSSNLYQIQFQYPGTWELSEKTSRFDEGTDISVSGFSPNGIIAIQYLNTSTTQDLDFQSAVYELFKSSIDSDYSKEYKVIEQPSFVTIDNQKAGTYLYTHKDKYEEFATKWASQIWVVYVGNHGYLLSFMASTNLFDAPEIKNIRDQFIKSIKFLGMTNTTNSNVPNRFD